MKKLFVLLVIIMTIVSCEQKRDSGRNLVNSDSKTTENTETKDEDSFLGKILRGEHKLIKINDNYLYLDNGKIMFSWTVKDISYNSILPVTKVLFKKDTSVTEPYVKFKWAAQNSEKELNDYFESGDVIYMVVYANCDNLSQLYSKKTIDNNVVNGAAASSVMF